MTRKDVERGKRGREPEFTSVDRTMLEQIEALYGPIKRPEPATDATAGDPQLRKTRAGLAGSLLRTLLFVSAAFLAWYALAGGEASVQRTLELLVSGIGTEPPAIEAEPAPEYILAARTMHVDRLATDDPLIGQFKTLLDALAPKCKETRVQLAMAVIDAHAARLGRGVEAPMLTILAQADASLSEQTRSSWPTACAALMARL